MKVLYDIFPARALVIPQETTAQVADRAAVLVTDNKKYEHSRRVEAVRVVISDKRVLIAADANSGPVLIFNEQYDPATLAITTSRNSGTSYVETVTGKLIFFQKDQNCGCGSRLRGWNPYGTLYSTKDPTE